MSLNFIIKRALIFGLGFDYFIIKFVDKYIGN